MTTEISRGFQMPKVFFEWLEQSEYPRTLPYDPEVKYPECPFEFAVSSSEKNDIYRMIREIFIANDMDRENVDTAKWNPLGEYIVPGNVVLIKPNMVSHVNIAEKDKKKGLDCLITHPSVVRCLFDYVYIALQGRGKIIIADAPVQNCDFEILLKDSGYKELFCYLKRKETLDLSIDFADLRETVLYWSNGEMRQCENPKKKYKSVVVDLGEESFFYDIKNKKKLRVTNYAARDTITHHINGKNEYCVSEALLDADVIVNIPKPKTHRIAGYTAALKNMIGTNTRKEYLPHHRQGGEKSGGDEYLDSNQILKYMNTKGNDVKNWALKYQFAHVTKIANDFSRRIGRVLNRKEENRKQFGMWYGNDTIWRSILDVNHIVYFCNRNGIMCKEKQRKVIHFGDMIVCGEKEGPLQPSYKKVGGILFSDHPIMFDYCVVKLMGFHYKKFPVLVNALKDKLLMEEDNEKMMLRSNVERYNVAVEEIKDNFAFEPTTGWKGHI